MATYTFAQIKTKLNTALRDAADTTFTDAEKTEILTEVIENDPYCNIVAQDSSLSTGTNTISWTVPNQFQDVIDLGYIPTTNYPPHWLSRSAWDVVNGTIYLTERYSFLPQNKTITINGKKQLAITDSIPDYLVKYILELALVETFELLASVLGTRFLKNDITLAELRSLVAGHEAKAAKYRATLANKRLVVL